MAQTVLIERKKMEWYIQLIKDLQNLIAKRERVELETKHAIGKRILTEKPHIEESITQFLQKLANDLDYSLREIWYCVKFAETYPTMNDLVSDYAKSKGIPVENVSLNDLPTWHEIRNFVLSKGFEAIEEKGEKPPTEPKQCEMEKILNDFLTRINVERAETLNCKECEKKGTCEKVKPKILLLGEQMFPAD